MKRVRLVGRMPQCENRSHFYGIAAHLMRQILIDHARTRQVAKRGGSLPRLSLKDDFVVSPELEPNFILLDEALQRLPLVDARKAPVVELQFFGGLSVEESAEVMNVSEVTVRRDCQFAKTWLLRE